MPETAVGMANGRSTIASTSFLPGNEYRTSTQATISPKTALIAAADQRRAEGQLVRGHHARIGDRRPELLPS